jgi:adenine-specific DNA methylase
LPQQVVAITESPAEVTDRGTIEEKFDVAFVAELARREKQIQQSYRPVIGVHKWFARRPGTVFRSLLLSELGPGSHLATDFFQSHDLSGRIIGDPFMGGGTPILEANRLGCSTIGFDVNPMSFWVVRQELAPINRESFSEEAGRVADTVATSIGKYYETTCCECGEERAQVKYFIWVKQADCTSCGESIDLFPGYMVAKNDRHTHFVLVCGECGSLNQVLERPTKECRIGACSSCKAELQLSGPAVRGRCRCSGCGAESGYPQPETGPPRHRLVALEYHCPSCRHQHKGRYFKAPDDQDLLRFREASSGLSEGSFPLIPEDGVPPGDETTRLHRWGYHRFRELFNERQLLGLATLASAIQKIDEREVRFAIATVFSDILRYQNMLCRYDTYALKCLDIFSIHGYPVGLVQCEANLLGIPGIGSGGFRHFVEKYNRAKAYCEQPFETVGTGSSKKTIFTTGERIEASWIADASNMVELRKPRASFLAAASSREARIPAGALDVVLTDPPYFANVQYSELMDFCFHWLRPLVGKDIPELTGTTTRSSEEVTGNVTEGRSLADFTEGLSQVFTTFAQALKPGAPLAFTYHHNSLDAYVPLIVSILDAGLVCSATLPCPAEMGASIHINGTGSATVDTIFVCRSTGRTRRSWLAESLSELKALVKEDLTQLNEGSCRTTSGDAACLLFGHLARMTIWKLRGDWKRDEPIVERMTRARLTLRAFGSMEEVNDAARSTLEERSDEGQFGPLFEVREKERPYGDTVSF